MQNASNQGGSTASLGKIALGGAAAAPTIVDPPKELSPTSAATIKRLLGRS